MGFIEITIINLFISNNYRNHLFLIASIILLQLTLVLRKYIYLSLIISIMERHFLLGVPLTFPGPVLIPHIAALFVTLLSTVLRRQNILWRNLLFIYIIMFKRKN